MPLNLDPTQFGLIVLLVAFVAWYVAVRVAAGWDTSSDAPAWASAAVLPGAIFAAAAAGTGFGAASIAVASGCALCALTLVRGVTLLTGTTDQEPQTSATRLLLPVTAVVLLAGFGGTLTLVHVIALVAVGGAACWAWREKRLRLLSWQWLVGAALSVVGALAALVVVAISERESLRAGGPFVAALFASPMLLVPVIGLAGGAAQRGKAGPALAQLEGVALAYLAFVLPLAVAIWQVRAWLVEGTPVPAVPLRVFRVDGVLLLLLALAGFVQPRGGRRQRLIEGAVRVGVYLAYIATLIFNVRA